MAVAWSVIDGIVHGPDLLLADSGEAGALGETLTNQPVGVPVAAAPSWMEGQGEAEHRAGGLYDLLEVSELHTPVQGHGPALRMPSERADPHIGNVASGMRGAASSGEQTASAVHERDEARPGAFADDGVAFPVAEPGTFLHDLGTLPAATGARDLATPFLRPAPPVPAFAFMTQTRPDSTAGTRQAGWIKPPLVDRPVDRGRKDHQSRPLDRDPARDPPGRPMLPHDKTPHKPRPSLAVEDPGPHAGNPSGLAATLGGRCTMAPPRANGERVSGHLPADGRFVPARRSGHPAAAIPPRLSNTISSRSAKARRAYRPMGPPDTWSSQANTIVSGTHGPTSSTSVAPAMKKQGTNSWKGFGKETYWNEYWREGDTVVQYKCRKAKFFDGDENVHDEDKTEVCSWAVGDLSMPEWLEQYL